MRVCIVGGSFNPPHRAHKKIIKTLTNMYDKVIVIPCGVRPDKMSANVIPVHNRMEMVRMAFSEIKKVIIDFYDFENNVYTPTVFLQERYKKIFPGCEIWHLVGEDIVKDIKEWEPDGEKIWNELNFLVVVREGCTKAKELPPHYRVLEIGNAIGSGTLVRERVSNNERIDDLVEWKIEEYIKANNLYRRDKMNETEYEVDTLVGIFKGFKDKIYKYKYPEELFEELEGDSSDEKLNSLKKKFRNLIFDYGADRYNHYDSQELFDSSSEIARKITELKDAAERMIVDGTYGERKGENNFTVNGKYEYQINSLDSEGDFSQTFLGAYKDNGKVEHVCIKMAKVADEDNVLLDDNTVEENNDLLNHEINTLKYMDTVKDNTFQKVRKQHFPIIIDDFMSSSGYVDVDIKRCAMVTKHIPAYDFVSLREKFPNGVPLYHACWMLARMLSAIGHLHYNGIIHGNIHPEGLFVNAKDHNVTLADLEFSVLDYTSKNMKYAGVTEYYTAPEVCKGVKPHPRTDIYSIGMCMIYILGGDIEKRTLPLKFEIIGNTNPNINEIKLGIERIRNLILSFVNQHPLARSDDAWKAYHQLSTLRHMTFGKQSFQEFVVPK